MNLPSKPSPSEEPAQQLVSHASEETPTQPSLASDSRSEENELQASSPSEPITEATEQQPSSPSEPIADETVLQPVDSASDSLTQEDNPAQSASSSEPATEETETQTIDSEPLAENDGSAPDEVEVFDPNENDDDADAALEPEEPGSSLFQPMQSGLFIHKNALIAIASALVVVALLVAILVFVTRPKDPPTDWIASYIPTGSSSSAKTLYYLHWTNKNGELTGQLQLAENPSGTPQSLTVPATGLYNRDNHIIYVVVTASGQSDTLIGKINDNNDTLTLNLAGATSQDGQLVFHIGSADDYKKATQQLGPKK